MPHVRAAAAYNFVEIDDGVVVRPNSFVNVDTTRPLAAAAITAGELEVLDAEPAPPRLEAHNVIRFLAEDEPTALGLLASSQFAFFLDPTPGATKLHAIAKDSGGTIRRFEWTMS